MIIGIDHIDMAVKDLDATVETFLKLGFELVRRTSHHNGTAEVKLPGPNQPIFDLHPITEDHGADFTGVVHIAFAVDDVPKSYEEMKAAGLDFGPKQVVHAVKSTGRLIYNLADPVTLGGSSAIPGWGLYLQFVATERKETA